MYVHHGHSPARGELWNLPYTYSYYEYKYDKVLLHQPHDEEEDAAEAYQHCEHGEDVGGQLRDEHQHSRHPRSHYLSSAHSIYAYTKAAASPFSARPANDDGVMRRVRRSALLIVFLRRSPPLKG